MVDIVLTILCLSGFIYASHRWLKIDFSCAPLFSVSLLGILLFIFAVSNQLETGTRTLIYTGYILSAICGIDVWHSQNTGQSFIPVKLFMLFVSLIVISYLITLGMKFTVIDDYVYWGIMGKYLYINNSLPMIANPLDTRILAYTPGTALIHYFFYVLVGKYSVSISYFAQNIILISSLFIVTKKENIQKSIVYICMLIFLLTVFFGSIFTKLQVDYLLSIILFSVFWSYYNEKNIYLKLLVISMPTCFLFLIKEIGFILGLLILVIIFFDVVLNKTCDKKNKFKTVMFIIIIVALLFVLKKLWMSHVSSMGFVEFHSAVNWASIKTTLHIFSDKQIQNGFLIFIKEIFIGSADRLNIPYVLWYIFIVFLGYQIFKKSQVQERSRLFLFSGLLLISFFFYLFLLYCLQIIVFGLGSSSEYTIGFARYLNILFSPIVFIVIISFFHLLVLKQREVRKKTSIYLMVIIVLVLFFSRVEVSLHRDKQDIQIQEISEQIVNKLNHNIHSIAVIAEQEDGVANLQFLYHLLPNKVDYKVKKITNNAQLKAYIVKYDYILLYYPNVLILEWIKSYTKDISTNPINFFRVQQTKTDNILLTEITL